MKCPHCGNTYQMTGYVTAEQELQRTATPDLPENVSSTEKLVTCKGQPEPHIRIHACREPIVQEDANQ